MLYNQDTAILLLIFNRPDTTEKVFEVIRKARPKKLYVSGDGPRDEKESILCEKARSVINEIDWPCQVKTLFRNENKGCKIAVSEGINWFFENEEEGIVLEDDCLPSESFFGFCSVLLEKYRNDTRIGHIGGSNLQLGQKRGNDTYYFSRMTHAWGWAGWRRVWETYDVNMKTYPLFKKMKILEKIPSHAPFIHSWEYIFQENYLGRIDSWAYPYSYHNLVNNRLSIIPNINLISNIGFREDSTHTADSEHAYASLETGILDDEMTHPVFVIADIDADIFTQIQEGHTFSTKKEEKNILLKTIKKNKTRLSKKIKAILQKS